jgi:putative tricarboxylic transport membrane protein
MHTAPIETHAFQASDARHKLSFEFSRLAKTSNCGTWLANAQTKAALGGLVPGQPTGMQRLETTINVGWVLLGSSVCIYSVQLGLMGPFGPDSGFFPLLAGLTILASSACLLLTKAARRSAGAVFWPDTASRNRVLGLLLIMIAMFAAMPYLGFALCGCIATPLMMRAVGDCSWRYAIAVGIIASLSIYVVFVLMLQTPLPRGPFGW